MTATEITGPAGPEATADEVRAAVRAFLAEAWDPDASLVEWRTRLVDAGWACPSWPVGLCGRGLRPEMDDVVAAELHTIGAPSTPIGAGMSLAAPTILAHGSDELQQRLLRPLVTGEESWCQLFSEPGAGSDLAGVTTTAVRDGDEWIVRGQKVWNTSAHHAEYGLLVARTDWDKPKHRGLTYFALPMHQPGVEVRPLRQMNERSSFNEVFLDEARIHDRDRIGAEGDGWAVALTTLAHERRLATLGARRRRDRVEGRCAAEAEAEAAEYFRTYEWYPQRAGRPDLVVPRARTHHRVDDPMVRQQLAALTATQRAAQWTAQRAQAARALGRPPGAEGSIGKLSASIIARASAVAHTSIAGPHGMLTGPESPEGGVVAEVLVSVPAQSIAGGTDEIQHNILGERILGLPREPDHDGDRPYRDVRHG